LLLLTLESPKFYSLNLSIRIITVRPDNLLQRVNFLLQLFWCGIWLWFALKQASDLL